MKKRMYNNRENVFVKVIFCNNETIHDIVVVVVFPIHMCEHFN
jgi:hypothetical protein